MLSRQSITECSPQGAGGALVVGAESQSILIMAHRTV